VVRVAHTQFGVVTVGQLVACGLSRDQIKRLADRGHLHRLHRGVYAVGHRRLVDHAWLIAALLACGPTAFLSHRTAAAVWGLRPVAVKAIEITVTGGASRKRLIVHRASVQPNPDDVRTRNGLRVSSVPRLLVELGSRERPAELTRLVTQAARKRVLEVDKIEEALGRHARRPGLARVKEALSAYRPGPDRKSDLEIAFDALLEEHPDIPRPIPNVTIAGWEIDCYWPGQSVALELDGRPYHVAVRDMEKDRLKDAKLLGLGIRPLRITGARLEHDARDALADLRTLLQLG
jgi:hypothetical protein